MDSIRVELRELVVRENASLELREAAFTRDMRLLDIGITATSALALFGTLVLGYLLRQRVQQEAKNLVHAETAHVLAAQQEIHARLMAANAALAESEERLTVTLSSIGDGVMTTDADARIVSLNPVAAAMTGWSSAEAAGRPVNEVLHIVGKETRALATIPVAETLAHGTIQGLANHTVLIARDGRECDIADSCAPIRDRDGLVIGAVLVFRDVTADYHAQQALRDSLALIETVLNTVADGIITFHASDGTVAKANPAAERIFGYSSQELLGREIGLLVPDLGHEHLVTSLDVYRPSPEARATELGREVVGRRKNTSTVPLEIAVSDMTLGGQRYFTSIVRDITARKAVEEALREAGALQRAIFNSANFSSIATDEQGVIQIFNVGAERMLGYDAADVLNTITPADISDPLELIARARALSDELGTPITPGFEALVFKASRGIEDIYELTYIRRDGSRFPAVVSVTALRDAHGVIIGYLLIGTDNTARKLVEAEQRKLDQRLRDQQFYTRSLIEANSDAILTTDPSGIITDVNRQMEALTGGTRDELIGAPFKDHFTDPARAEAAITLVLTEKTISDYELTARNREGKSTVVSYNLTTFYDRNRTLQGVFAAARDVTERKRVEMELKKAKAAAESSSRSKSDFLASMSHEIRTPMNAIMGIADLLAKTPLSAEQLRFVQIFRRSGDNLLNLINDILDLSKVEASQLELEQTSFSLSELLQKVQEMVSARAQEKGLAVVYEIAPGVPIDLIGDPTRLQQVLLNLLGNAIKFTESGTITLRVTDDENFAVPTAVRFTVTDTGIGIAEDKLARVFERFTQADSSTTRRFGGSGLGLTICRRLVELMGGRISVESTVGVGSIFSFAVPFELSVADAQPLTAPISPEQERPLLPLRILLVEDSDDNCTITVAYLAETPYVVEIAANGAIALEMFTAGHYDLVLMDRQMPVMDGLTSTRAIRGWEQAHHRAPTPIIALTASALKGDREQCLAAGCTAFLTKPIRQDVLLRAIVNRTVMARVQSREERIQNLEVLVPENPQIAARVPTFLRNRRSDVATMRDALSRDDLQMAERLGHNMRGTGASYGFQAIADIGGAIEVEAGRCDADATRHWVDELSLYLDRVAPPIAPTSAPPTHAV
jgi:PAS domain S-box-containing protein